MKGSNFQSHGFFIKFILNFSSSRRKSRRETDYTW